MKFNIAAVCFLLFAIIGLATYSICSASYVESETSFEFTHSETRNTSDGVFYYKIGQDKSPIAY